MLIADCGLQNCGIGEEAGVGLERGDLLVGVGGDDEADHVFDVPTGVAKFGGEPVEELGVGREFSLGAEVIDGGAECGVEEERPEAVHDGAGGDGVFFGSEPVGEVEAGEALGLGAFEAGREEGGGGGEDDGAGFVLPVAPGEDTDGERGWDGLGDESVGAALVEIAGLRGELNGGVESRAIVGGAEEEEGGIREGGWCGGEGIELAEGAERDADGEGIIAGEGDLDLVFGGEGLGSGEEPDGGEGGLFR